MDFRHLTDEVLVEQLEAAVAAEAKAEIRVLHLLAEVERRHLFSKKHPSLFEFCRDHLKYANGVAQRKIDTMHMMNLVPEVEARLRDRSLNTTNIHCLQAFFRHEAKSGKKYSLPEKKELLKKIENVSTRKCQKILVEISPEFVPKEKRRPLTKDKTELKIIADEETIEMIDQLKALMSHKNPRMTDGELLKELAKMALEKLDPAKQKSYQRAEQSYKSVPVATKRKVWIRDGGKCTHPGCHSKHFLEFDHITPLAFGGTHEESNLRLLCRVHNQRAAIEKMGLMKITQHFQRWQ